MQVTHTGAALRNRIPILLALQKYFGTRTSEAAQTGYGLDISAGTGAHLEVLAPAFPSLQWTPTEYITTQTDRSALDILDANLTGIFSNIQRAVRLDASQPFPKWPPSIHSLAGEVHLILSCNVVHITPWSVAIGLFHGVSQLLNSNGVFAIYGPFAERGVFSSSGNRSFDAHLRSQNSEWGIRDLEKIIPLAQSSGLQLQRRLEMPANNLLLLFVKKGSE